MLKVLILLLTAALAAAAAVCSNLTLVCENPSACPIMQQAGPALYDVLYVTTAGNFTVHVNTSWAPPYANRFWQLSQLGYMVGAPFYRVDFVSVTNAFVVQFGYRGEPAGVYNLFMQMQFKC